MRTLVENVAKVTAAHAALKEAIAAKGVAVPDGAKLTDMPALVRQISTEPVQTYPRASFAGDISTNIVVPKTLVVADVAMETNMSYFFTYCNSLTSLTLPEGFGQAATNLRGCFMSCPSLSSLTLPEGFGQAAERMYNTFAYCNSLTSLTLPEGFGQNSILNLNCFVNCTSLTTITGNPNFKVSLDLSYSTKLTHDSLMVVINGLQTVTTKQTLTLGSTNLAKLTDDEKKVATDKGWTLA